MHLIVAHLRRIALGDERGFAMVAVMAMMAVATVIAVAAVNAVGSDRPASRDDRERKQAYAAAEAGVNDYMAHLLANVDYWRMCASDPTNSSLWSGTGTRPPFKAVTGTTTGASYQVVPLPANGASACDPADPEGTFIDVATGTFRIRATGQVREGGRRRSIVATFKRRGFLDYVYFTDFETPSPEFYKREARGMATRETGCTTTPENPNCDIVGWAKRECVRYYRDGGQRAIFTGERQRSDGTWESLLDYNGNPPKCGEINFVTGDNQNGPFHTNDEILLSGTPRFGRRPSDDIEVSAPEPVGSDGVITGGGLGSSSGWRAPSGGSPQVNDPATSPPVATYGTWRKSSPIVSMPPSNTTLRDEAAAAYRFVGETTIVLTGTTMTVTGKRENGTVLTGASMPMPVDGVIYVGDDPAAACTGFDPARATDLAQPGCGDVRIRGTYARNVTITAQNDIRIEEDITRSSTDDVMLGLIADDWVRVHHPVSNYDMAAGTCTNNGGPGSITIQAAVLAVNDSFTVDRYWCGAALGTITVEGAIAQAHRGAVGTGGGSTGYIKDYTYDDRLRFRTPPKFLDPVQSSWRLQSQVEQVPAT